MVPKLEEFSVEELQKQLNSKKIDIKKAQEEIVRLNGEIEDKDKQIIDLFHENRKLRKKLENYMTFEDYEYTLNKKIQLENQQKEFIKWLENESKEIIRDAGYHQRICLDILEKYKEIIGD